MKYEQSWARCLYLPTNSLWEEFVLLGLAFCDGPQEVCCWAEGSWEELCACGVPLGGADGGSGEEFEGEENHCLHHELVHLCVPGYRGEPLKG